MAARFDSGSLETYGAVQSTGAGVSVPDAALLFTGDFSRSGTDLTLTGSDGAKFVVAGYFETDTPPSLISPQGAMLTGDVVTSLAGPQFPGMYAQAGGGAATAAKEIGKVQSLDGSGSVVRTNGVTETLKAGDPVYEGDVVMTGPASKMGIGFVDGTVFSMSASARMVLNSLVYDANGSDNSMLFNLVEGSFVFAAGQIAPTGDMKIQTPVATMGIRGTAPTVDINSESGTVNFSIIPDPGDGHIGTYTLYSLDTKQPIGTISSVGTKWVLTSADGTITELDKTEDDLLKDADAVNQINSVYNTYQNNSQNPQAGPENNGPPSSSGLNTNTNQGENVDGGGTPGQGGGEQPPPPPPSGEGGQSNNTPPPPQNNEDLPPENGGETGPTGQTITGTPNVDVLNGTEGNDTINGLGSGDFIFGNGGNDIIDGGEGEDIIDAGAGNDTIIISANEADIIDGGEGTDTLLVEGDLDLSTKTNLFLAENIEILDLNTTDANEFTISAQDIEGVNDDSTLTIIGGGDGETTPRDTVNLSPEFFENVDGEDVPVFGAWSKPFLNDDGFWVYEFYAFDSSESDPPLATVLVGDGIDVVVGQTVVGSEESDFGETEINGTPGPDFVFAQGGDDTIVGGHGEGDDHYDGGEGTDTITYLSATNGVIINLVDSTVQGDDIGFDTIASLERFVSGSGNDTLIVGENNVVENFFFHGGGGIDTIQILDGLNIDTSDFAGEAENIEVIDLNKTHDNTLRISVDDFIDAENDTSSLRILGGATDTVILTNLLHPKDFFEGGEGQQFISLNDGPPRGFVEVNGFNPEIPGAWQFAGTTDLDGQDFDIYLFFPEGSDVPIATAEIEHGIDIQAATGFGTVRDEFDAIAYDGNNGTMFWTSDWVEVNDDHGSATNGEPTQGEISVQTDLVAPGPGHQLFLTDNDSEAGAPDFVQRSADLSGASTAVLTFDFRRVDLEANDEIQVYASSNGTDFVLIGEIQGTGINDPSYQTASFDLTDFISDNTTIRFGVSDALSNGDFLYVDNVTITYETIEAPAAVDVGSEGQFASVELGTSEADQLSGLGGNDLILGFDGDDVIEGGSGDNVLTGGQGADKFVITGLDDGIDTITDFSGVDTLDLTGLLGGALPDSQELGEIIGQYVQAITNGNDTTVSVDLDGGGENFGFTEIATLQGVGTGVNIAVTIGDEHTTVESAAAAV